MARTQEEIFNSLLEIKNGMSILTGLTGVSDYQTLLSDVNSSSVVSNWGLELFNQSVTISAFETMIDAAIAEIQIIKDDKEIGTKDWLIDQVLKFQYGDVLQLIDNVPSYVSVDTTKQIIEFCSISEESGVAYIKVRRKGGTLLSTSEYNALLSYLDKVTIVGTQYVIYNYSPDNVKLVYNIIYSGERGYDVIKDEVEDAISNYLSMLPFDSNVTINVVTDALQEIVGVVDARYEGVYHKKSTDVAYIDYGLVYTLPLYAGNATQTDFTTITYTLG